MHYFAHSVLAPVINSVVPCAVIYLFIKVGSGGACVGVLRACVHTSVSVNPPQDLLLGKPELTAQPEQVEFQRGLIRGIRQAFRL